MKFKVDSTAGTNTHLVGYFNGTRQNIESIFGAPTYTTSDKYEKVTAEWGILFEDGTEATIYDWKRYDEGTPEQDEMYEWHIGGRDSKAVEYVGQVLGVNSYAHNIHEIRF